MTIAIIDATHHAESDAADDLAASRYTMPLANIPLISHVVTAAASAGAERVRVLAARGDGSSLTRALSTTAGGAPAEVVEVAGADSPRAVLAELDLALGSGPVLLVPGDGLHRALLTEMVERFSAGDVDAVLDAAVAATEGRLSGSPVMLGPRARPLIAGMLGDGATSLVDALLAEDLRLAVCAAAGGWAYDGATAALLAGNRRALDDLTEARVTDELAAANELHGRVVIGHDVIASGCIVHGPVAIADRAVLEDSHLGPFTSIGPGAIVSGAELEDSIVLGAAEIRHPGHRITASVIGVGARVDRGFALPRGMRLRLGAGSHLRFS